MTTFKPATRGLLYETVAEQLREAILDGHYRPGDRLPTEGELTQEFQVSRAVIRQATMSLEGEGLVDVQVGAGGGTYVLDGGIEAVLRAFENLFRHRGFSPEHYLAAKAVLEPALCAAVVVAATPADERRLEDILSDDWSKPAPRPSTRSTSCSPT
ncbi:MULTISPECIES: FadR/GntR family transcriptional regulator [Rhodococcus]|uniref:GntR family transcriptional regulator n=1 Tax=Rhodococcus oxybenzonivorans TaxID=1990687 RepID=A0AAE4UV52_9NOCA|nr:MULTISPECIES: GntR family transcriptional regulator [Rhodococcus]MDV7244340.1 GntR family transcriptional regulator [Rhodococcus oxybenzonivorans]MDV7263501.1 GntR family transcriptional regulator [Rhodococcus oxybenzonivorans]MDV7274417.1 GntR family transcriptional regulator [Rhodococcus oxybenzonivorans]MDV7335730.1 GntR family transcriptional regulator [Rhodococcus oxybenzonivorans]MDV7345367.1 GntR family transcriptional regulator [Rhodococcus oxybenzonivorans]